MSYFPPYETLPIFRYAVDESDDSDTTPGPSLYDGCCRLTKLRGRSNWNQWYQEVTDCAITLGIWEYVDPDGTHMLEEPEHPQPPNYEPLTNLPSYGNFPDIVPKSSPPPELINTSQLDPETAAEAKKENTRRKAAHQAAIDEEDSAIKLYLEAYQQVEPIFNIKRTEWANQVRFWRFKTSEYNECQAKILELRRAVLESLLESPDYNSVDENCRIVSLRAKIHMLRESYHPQWRSEMCQKNTGS